MIRVWIETASNHARWLGVSARKQWRHPPGGFSIQADVVLLDELPDKAGAHPALFLSDETLTSRVLRLGVHAILPRETAAEQIVAALYAASAGLIAIPAESSSLIVPAASESMVENLTPREMETLEMLAEGLSNKQIAARLSILRAHR